MVKALTKIYIYFICLFEWDNAQLFFICSLLIRNKKHLMLCKTTLNYNKLVVKGPVSNTRLLFIEVWLLLQLKDIRAYALFVEKTFFK